MIFTQYNYTEYHNGNKDLWPISDWCKIVNDNIAYCKTIKKVFEFKGRCEICDLPSFHPYWKYANDKKKEELAKLHKKANRLTIKKIFKNIKTKYYTFRNKQFNKKLGRIWNKLLKDERSVKLIHEMNQKCVFSEYEKIMIIKDHIIHITKYPNIFQWTLYKLGIKKSLLKLFMNDIIKLEI